MMILLLLLLLLLRGERWLGFPDLWSSQKPWWNWYLTPVVNFGEVRRAQLAKSTLLTSTWCPWDLFRSFKVCSDAKERLGCGKQWEATAHSSLVKLQSWFLSFRWKTCLWSELQAWYSSLQRKTCPWAEHSDDELYLCHIINYIKSFEISFISILSWRCVQ